MHNLYERANKQQNRKAFSSIERKKKKNYDELEEISTTAFPLRLIIAAAKRHEPKQRRRWNGRNRRCLTTPVTRRNEYFPVTRQN